MLRAAAHWPLHSQILLIAAGLNVILMFVIKVLRDVYSELFLITLLNPSNTNSKFSLSRSFGTITFLNIKKY